MRNIVAVCCLVVVGCCPKPDKSEGSTGTKSSTVTAAATTQAQPAKAKVEPIVIKAADLSTQYDKNEVAADDKYKGKLMLVVGRVTSIDKGLFDSIRINLAGSNQFFEVIANMEASEKSKAASLEKGKIITVRCTGAGMMIKSPVLDDCTVEKVYDK